jgi:predicted DNA-binding antitoxin AbrB/MazE fold protein
MRLVSAKLWRLECIRIHPAVTRGARVGHPSPVPRAEGHLQTGLNDAERHPSLALRVPFRAFPPIPDSQFPIPDIPHILPHTKLSRRFTDLKPSATIAVMNRAKPRERRGTPWAWAIYFAMDREQDIHFVYENGVLRPQEPVDLPEGARGVAHIRTSEASEDPELGAQSDTFSEAWDDDEDAVYDKM